MHDDGSTITVRERVPSRRWPRLVVSAVLCVALFLAASCSEDARDQISDAVSNSVVGGDGTTPAPDPDPAGPPAEPDLPAEPEAPVEPAPAPPTEPDPAPGSKMSSEDWLVLAFLAVAAVALIVGATAIAGRRSRNQRSFTAGLDQRVRQIAGAGQWVYDQGSMDVLRVSDPDQLRAVWGSTRAQMLDLEGHVAGLNAVTTDPALANALRRLGLGLASLRGALDSSVSLRLDPNVAARATLVERATQAVLDRRRELEMVLRPLAGVGMETR